MGSSAATPELAATSVLLVDDERALLAITKRRLEKKGYRVVACGSGAEAQGLAGGERFDVMVSDIHMPNMTGVGLLRAVRAQDLDIPVILITGNPGVETAIAAIEYGAFQYLVKPVDQEQLEGAIDRAAAAGRLARLKREYIDQFGSGVSGIGDRAGIDATLDRALDSLWMAFQPIVWADGRVFAHEALMRSVEPKLPHPGAVLEAAERVNRLQDVGRNVRTKVAQAIPSGNSYWSYFVNLHPQDLLDPTLYGADEPLGRVAKQVVLEITERASLDELPDVRSHIAKLREMGFRIALDDLGAGYAGLTSFVLLEPDFVKLDISLVRDIHCNSAKQKIVGSMVTLCHDMGKQIVAEGVEQGEERGALLSLGCDLLQGYFFAKPGKPFPVPKSE